MKKITLNDEKLKAKQDKVKTILGDKLLKDLTTKEKDDLLVSFGVPEK